MNTLKIVLLFGIILSYKKKVIEILKNSTLFMFMQQASGARVHATAISLVPMLITE